MAQGHVAACALGPQTAIQGAQGRVVDDADASRVPQIAADQIVALGYLSSKRSTQRAATSSVKVASSGKTRAR